MAPNFGKIMTRPRTALRLDGHIEHHLTYLPYLPPDIVIQLTENTVITHSNERFILLTKISFLVYQ